MRTVDPFVSSLVRRDETVRYPEFLYFYHRNDIPNLIPHSTLVVYTIAVVSLQDWSETVRDIAEKTHLQHRPSHYFSEKNTNYDSTI